MTLSNLINKSNPILPLYTITRYEMPWNMAMK